MSNKLDTISNNIIKSSSSSNTSNTININNNIDLNSTIINTTTNTNTNINISANTKESYLDLLKETSRLRGESKELRYFDIKPNHKNKKLITSKENKLNTINDNETEIENKEDNIEEYFEESYIQASKDLIKSINVSKSESNSDDSDDEFFVMSTTSPKLQQIDNNIKIKKDNISNNSYSKSTYQTQHSNNDTAASIIQSRNFSVSIDLDDIPNPAESGLSSQLSRKVPDDLPRKALPFLNAIIDQAYILSSASKSCVNNVSPRLPTTELPFLNSIKQLDFKLSPASALKNNNIKYFKGKNLSEIKMNGNSFLCQPEDEAVVSYSTTNISIPEDPIIGNVVIIHNPRFSEVNINAKEWKSLNHVDLIHRQGIKAPPMMFEKMHGSDKERQYFQLYLPQVDDAQKEAVLCCRKKSSENKYRFSLDPSKMTKKDNLSYIGKMTCKNDKLDDFLVTLADQSVVAQITITNNGHTISCELLNQYLNAQEVGRSGRILVGTMQSYMQPYISLAVESNHRAVLSIYNPNDSDAIKATPSENIGIKYVIEFNYPLTIFLSFCIICVAQAYKGT